MRRTLLLAACVCALTTSSVFASLVTWEMNPATVNGNAGSISDGGSEHSLGLVGTTDNQLQVNSTGSVPQSTQLDVRSIVSASASSGGADVIAVPTGKSFPIVASKNGEPLSGFDEKFVTVPDFGAYQFIALASEGDDSPSIEFSGGIAPVPEMNALFPILGLVAAISATQILRRRRSHRLAAGQNS